MITPDSVSACLVTKGTTDLSTILASLPCEDIVLWDNSDPRRENRICYGRFLAAQYAGNDVIYTQDDDCLVPIAGLLKAYEGTMIVNVPDDEAPLTAWGALFPRDSIYAAFSRYLAKYPNDEFMWTTADVIHTTLTPWKRVHLGHADFPWATAPDRMYHQPGHYEIREEAFRRASRC